MCPFYQSLALALMSQEKYFTSSRTMITITRQYLVVKLNKASHLRMRCYMKRQVTLVLSMLLSDFIHLLGKIV